MDPTCPACGRRLSEHDRHVRFTLPDPVLDRDVREDADGVWMSHADARGSVFLSVDGIGSFVRALLPVRLTGGYSVTFGVWVGVAHEEMLRAHDVWFAQSYSGLVLEGYLANKVAPWSVLGAPVRLEVRNPDETPYCVSSPDSELSGVLGNTWDHEPVLAALPT